MDEIRDPEGGDNCDEDDGEPEEGTALPASGGTCAWRGNGRSGGGRRGIAPVGDIRADLRVRQEIEFAGGIVAERG